MMVDSGRKGRWDGEEGGMMDGRRQCATIKHRLTWKLLSWKIAR